MSLWIDVNDKYPPLNQDVLICAEDKDNCTERIIEVSRRCIFKIFPSLQGVEEWSSPWQYFHDNYIITHWMPLPDLPQIKAFWIGIDDEPYETWECDHCGHIKEFFGGNQPEFCDHCGAIML